MAMGIRIAIVLAGYVIAYIIIGREEVTIQDTILETIKRWDAGHLERISNDGYPVDEAAEHAENIVYLPLFPFTARIFAHLFGSWLIGALFISTVCSIAAGYFMQALTWNDTGDDAEAGRSLWYFFMFPTAYFLAMPYSEAMFMASLLGSFYFARKGNWVAAGTLGGFASAARLQGILIFPALILEVLHQNNFRRFPLGASWIVLSTTGFLVYLGINWGLHGDPLAFTDFQEDYWHHKSQPPWTTLDEAYQWITEGRADFNRVAIYELQLAATVLTAAVLLIGVRWLRPSYQFFGWSTLAFFLSASFLLSLPRYILTIFPMYFVMARLGRNQEVHSLLLSMSAVLFGVFLRDLRDALGLLSSS